MGLELGAKPAGESAKTPAAFNLTSKGGLAGIEAAFTKVTGDKAAARPESQRTQKFGILVYGTKNAGKSAALADLPRPNGGRTVFISFDEATYEGIANYWGTDWIEENRVEVYEVTKAIPDIGYPGYDPTRPETAEAVLGYVAYILRQLEEAGDVDNIILDHWQAAHEDIGQSYCRSLAGVGPTEKLDFRQWGPRKPMLRLIMMKAWAIAQHAIVASGYKEEEKITMEKVGGKTQVMSVVQDCRWLAPYQAPFKVSLEPYSVREKKTGKTKEAGGTRYYWHVDGSKNPIFPEGETVDLTDKSIRHFWERGSELEGIEDDEA